MTNKYLVLILMLIGLIFSSVMVVAEDWSPVILNHKEVSADGVDAILYENSVGERIYIAKQRTDGDQYNIVYDADGKIIGTAEEYENEYTVELFGAISEPERKALIDGFGWEDHEGSLLPDVAVNSDELWEAYKEYKKEETETNNQNPSYSTAGVPKEADADKDGTITFEEAENYYTESKKSTWWNPFSWGIKSPDTSKVPKDADKDDDGEVSVEEAKNYYALLNDLEKLDALYKDSSNAPYKDNDASVNNIGEDVDDGNTEKEESSKKVTSKESTNKESSSDEIAVTKAVDNPSDVDTLFKELNNIQEQINSACKNGCPDAGNSDFNSLLEYRDLLKTAMLKTDAGESILDNKPSDTSWAEYYASYLNSKDSKDSEGSDDADKGGTGDEQTELPDSTTKTITTTSYSLEAPPDDTPEVVKNSPEGTTIVFDNGNGNVIFIKTEGSITYQYDESTNSWKYISSADYRSLSVDSGTKTYYTSEYKDNIVSSDFEQLSQLESQKADCHSLECLTDIEKQEDDIKSQLESDDELLLDTKPDGMSYEEYYHKLALGYSVKESTTTETVSVPVSSSSSSSSSTSNPTVIPETKSSVWDDLAKLQKQINDLCPNQKCPENDPHFNDLVKERDDLKEQIANSKDADLLSQKPDDMTWDEYYAHLASIKKKAEADSNKGDLFKDLASEDQIKTLNTLCSGNLGPREESACMRISDCVDGDKTKIDGCLKNLKDTLGVLDDNGAGGNPNSNVISPLDGLSEDQNEEFIAICQGSTSSKVKDACLKMQECIKGKNKKGVRRCLNSLRRTNTVEENKERWEGMTAGEKWGNYLQAVFEHSFNSKVLAHYVDVEDTSARKLYRSWQEKAMAKENNFFGVAFFGGDVVASYICAGNNFGLLEALGNAGLAFSGLFSPIRWGDNGVLNRNTSIDIDNSVLCPAGACIKFSPERIDYGQLGSVLPNSKRYLYKMPWSMVTPECPSDEQYDCGDNKCCNLEWRFKFKYTVRGEESCLHDLTDEFSLDYGYNFYFNGNNMYRWLANTDASEICVDFTSSLTPADALVKGYGNRGSGSRYIHSIVDNTMNNYYDVGTVDSVASTETPTSGGSSDDPMSLGGISMS